MMFSRALLIGLVCLSLAACSTNSSNRQPTASKLPGAATATTAHFVGGRTAVNNFVTVVRTVKPVAEQVCLEAGTQLNCDFKIVVDETVNAPPNAFQTVDETGRPVIAFTISLIAQARNRDELAFIMAHEAAHHIRGHLQRQRQSASLGAAIAGMIFRGDQGAQRLGAALGARQFSKDFELEADALGTVITARAGYDPLIGAAFFNRIPDPGNRFLGTHPANADRIATVQRVAAGL